jgi:bleomycin hydrolase
MKRLFLLFALLLSIILPTSGQNKNEQPAKPEEGYKFTTVVDLKATPVKNQSATGTCWCFSTTSYIESELLRMGKGEYDLSEMFMVRQNYIDRIRDNYLRQGKGNIEEGGNSHDFIDVFKEAGVVPEEVYSGLNYGSPTHNHSEMGAFLKAVAAVPIQRKNQSQQYYQILNAVLDTYLGKVPETFTYKNKTYTPKSFAASLGLNPDDYIELTSFTHFPFYSQGVLEITDNWRMAGFYNLPIDELIETIDYAFANGYTVAWDGDVSESGFSHRNGYAVIPLYPSPDRGPMTDRARLERVAGSPPSQVEAQAIPAPGPEVNVTQELRQTGYETFLTTDDHGMHLTGIVKDQNGTKYYKTKNSWGTDRNAFGGYLNMSENYVRAKTLFIMVHKNAVPPAIKTKLGI